MASDEVKKASEVIHHHATKQRVQINLSESEWQTILDHLEGFNPDEAAELEFVVKDQPMMNVRVAAYSYGTRRCCAALQKGRPQE